MDGSGPSTVTVFHGLPSFTSRKADQKWSLIHRLPASQLVGQVIISFIRHHRHRNKMKVANVGFLSKNVNFNVEKKSRK